MPYVGADGTVTEQRTMLRVSLISDIFWAIVNGIGLFFRTLIDPSAPIPNQNRRSEAQVNTYKANRYGNGGGNGGSGGGTRGANIRTLPKNCTTNK